MAFADAAAAGPVDVGAVMLTVVHAPAVCRVPTSFTSRASTRSSAAVSDVSVASACASAFVAASRRASAADAVAVAPWSLERRSFAATLSYSRASTPFASRGPKGVVPPTFVNELLTYSPALTYSSTANRRRAVCAASSLSCAPETADDAAVSSWCTDTSTLWSADDVVTAAW